MKQVILFVVFVCLLWKELVGIIIPTEIRPNPRFFLPRGAALDCSQYSHDYEIISSFPFVTLINPLVGTSSQTYGLMSANEKVYYLNIVNQTFLPKTVFCLNSLRNLYVYGTSFYEFESDNDSVPGIPSEIELLAPSLWSLRVGNTKLNRLPEQIGSLSHLDTLSLSNTDLVALPDSVGNLSSLDALFLENNKLISLPASMKDLQSLRVLGLNSNPNLRSIQSISGLLQLYSLLASNCSIERLPLNLPGLNFLFMNNNNLTDLIGIGTLGNNNSSLGKDFRFDMNRIRFVPPQIRNVYNLQELVLQYNELTTLPTELFSMTTLYYLDIRNNHFSPTELSAIVDKFNTTNSNLFLLWSSARNLS